MDHSRLSDLSPYAVEERLMADSHAIQFSACEKYLIALVNKLSPLFKIQGNIVCSTTSLKPLLIVEKIITSIFTSVTTSILDSLK